MKKSLRVSVLALAVVCLLLQVVVAAPLPVSGGNLVMPESSGHASWVPAVIDVEAEKEPVDTQDIYVSPATGVGAAAIVTCVSAAGLAVLKLTKKKEQ